MGGNYRFLALVRGKLLCENVFRENLKSYIAINKYSEVCIKKLPPRRQLFLLNLLCFDSFGRICLGLAKVFGKLHTCHIEKLGEGRNRLVKSGNETCGG
jgi:hypothetical protein